MSSMLLPISVNVLFLRCIVFKNAHLKTPQLSFMSSLRHDMFDRLSNMHIFVYGADIESPLSVSSLLSRCQLVNPSMVSVQEPVSTRD